MRAGAMNRKVRIPLIYEIFRINDIEMIAVSSITELYYLSFLESSSQNIVVSELSKKYRVLIRPGTTSIIEKIQSELNQFFAGNSFTFHFQAPLCDYGTPFQNLCWESLKKIPLGQTRSYSEIALDIGRPGAHRAVARALASNPFLIMVPCHRVVASDGKLSGYRGGMQKKKMLIEHEKNIMTQHQVKAYS